MNLIGKIVLVTGAGSGIGRETAKAFAKEGAKLVLCDIKPEAVAETADLIGSAVVLTDVVDVASKNSMKAFAERVSAEVGVVDVLVNNAGVGLAGGLLDVSEEDLEWVMNINLWGVMHGCKQFVPKMVERKQGGHIVNVASAAGYYASAGMLGYNTSKFAVFGFTEALREDMRPFGIGVTTVCPGVVHTNIINETRIAGAADEAGIRNKIDKIYAKRGYGPDKVAAAIVKAVKKNKGILPVTPEAWVMYVMNRISPVFSHWLFGKVERASTPEAAGSSFTHPQYKR